MAEQNSAGNYQWRSHIAINSRAQKQFEILTKKVDFLNKTVIDLGCGHGDILFMSSISGASSCVGVDYNQSIVNQNKLKNTGNVSFVHQSIEEFIAKNASAYFDVSVCFSVLAYLSSPESVVNWMKSHSKIAFIESQYNGDGPGFLQIHNDYQMQKWIGSGDWIGETYIEGRDRWRSIWMIINESQK